LEETLWQKIFLFLRKESKMILLVDVVMLKYGAGKVAAILLLGEAKDDDKVISEN
jgi:hypothetical protein